MTFLWVSGLGRRFGGLAALEGVSFDVSEGEILGIMGANGAGKTTLFALVSGHLVPTSGEIGFAGRLITGLSPDRICRLGIVRTFQIVRPFRGRSVRENVAVSAVFGASPALSQAEAVSRADEILGEVGLRRQADRLAGELTLCDQKRLEVARALAARPRVLLLDEVMAGLTPSEVAAMVELVREVRRRRGLTILIVEHVMRALVDLSERIVVLHHGRFVMSGAPEQVAGDARVLAAYYGEGGP